jgi:integrase
MESMLLDAAGHRRSPATTPGYHRGRPPRNKGEEYPADPPTIEEIIAVMRAVGDRPEGHRLRALIVMLWRAGLRISEALALQESGLDRSRGAVRCGAVRCGARAAWQRRQAPRGRDGPLGLGTARPMAHHPPTAPDRRAAVCDSRTDSRSPLGTVGRAQAAASRGCCGGVCGAGSAPHQLRHAHAVQLAREGVAINIIQRQVGHYAGDPANLGITSVYLQGIDSSEIISTVHGRPSPTISADPGLRLRR